MAGLADFRKEHPEYNDMGDAALGDALHKKFYSDIPKADFDKKMGLQGEQGYVEGVKSANAGVDKAAGSGVVGGLKKIAGGAEADINIVSSIVAPIAGFAAASMEKAGGGSAKDVRESYEHGKENFTYEPKTETGKAITKTVGAAVEPVGTIVDFPGRLAEKVTGALGLDADKAKLLHQVITDFLPVLAGPEVKGATGVVVKGGIKQIGSSAGEVASKIADKAVELGAPKAVADKAVPLVKKLVEEAVKHKLGGKMVGVADKATNRPVLTLGKYQDQPEEQR